MTEVTPLLALKVFCSANKEDSRRFHRVWGPLEALIISLASRSSRSAYTFLIHIQLIHF